MTAQPKQHAIRRSTRLPLEVPVRLTSLDPALPFSEECTTTLVNAHGCGLITQRSLPRDLPVQLEIVRSGRQTTARVADVVSLGGEPETWLLGMELDTPGNFWGIEYAPSDWKIEEVPPAAAALPDSQEPAPAHSPTPGAGRRWRLTDISAGACYLEAAQPMPIGTQVLISVRVAGHESLLDGIIRASHPDGIGVEFTSKDRGKRAAELIQYLVEHREVPRVFVGAKEDTSSIEPETAAADPADDPLLELVRQGDTLPLEQFLDDLKAQRLGERAEPRVDVILQVHLAGTDAQGEIFEEDVETRNISSRGAQLQNVDSKLRSGDIVSIRYGGNSDKFRVTWVGASLTPLAGQIGVVTVESTTSIWDEVIATAQSEAPQIARGHSS
ncbi:MAG TPA: PilZ domain-containing protein [Terriglobales bacterium]|nr:PilZ domain-containing protein [Terriglobales bacterium]